MMRDYYPHISHQFDVWHFAKSIKKRLSKLAKKKDKKELNDWIKSIINHFWWCSASCDNNFEILKEKWLSVLYHIRGITLGREINILKNVSMANSKKENG